MENAALDTCFQYRSAQTEPPQVVIVALDDETLAATQKPLMFLSPELAKVVSHVRANGALAVGIDFLAPENISSFEEASPNEVGGAARLGEAVMRHGKVILPELKTGDHWLLPPPEWHDPLRQEWTEFGYVNIAPDPDMVVRRQPLKAIGKDGVAHPSFACAIFGASRDLPPQWFDQSPIAIDGRALPLDETGNLLINYRGPPRTIPMVSFQQVIQEADLQETAGTKPQHDWKNKIVLIGATSQAIPDHHAHPFMNKSIVELMGGLGKQRPPELMPGIEIHANVVQTLVDRSFIATPWWLSTPLMLLITGVAMGIVLVRVNLEIGLLIAFVHHWLWKVVCVAGFNYMGWRIEMVSVLILGAMVFAVVFVMRWRWIRRMMGMVKSEAVARALEADPSKLDLQGEEREVTVLFSDIRGFTSYSERHTAHEVVALLNEYFAIVVPTIEQHGGIVNTYIGDGMMVLFGAPEYQPDHAARALRAGIKMVQQVHENQANWEKKDAPEFRIGIGIHTGRVVVGTIGSPNRLDYTAIGDTVNVSARIESGNKDLGSELLISEATLRSLPAEAADLRALVGEAQPLAVKGKEESLTVHAVDVSAVGSSDQRQPAMSIS